MRYAYHFEFCERPEIPQWLRRDFFLTLAWVQGRFGLKKVLSQTVPSLIEQSGADRLIELGSGSGDGLSIVADALSSFEVALKNIHCTATDVFPQTDLWRSKFANHENLGFSEDPVSFENFSSKLSLQNSIVLLVSAFHHIPQTEARDFLRRCALGGAHVLVIEPLSRSFTGVLLGALAGLPAFVAPLFLPGLSLRQRLRLVLDHWLVPIVPFILAHDGIVSAFRQRRSQDWQALTQGLSFELVFHAGLGPLRNFSAVLLKSAR